VKIHQSDPVICVYTRGYLSLLRRPALESQANTRNPPKPTPDAEET
jgi:hypothetical protein